MEERIARELSYVSQAAQPRSARPREEI
jgi:hypothetical protein